MRLGGKIIRQSLFTDDVKLARSIRDRFVIPILAASSGIAALESIGKSILDMQKEAADNLGQLRNIITGGNGITLADGLNLYADYLEKNTYRPATKQKYYETVRGVIDFIGENHAIATLSKQDAVRLRNNMIDANKGATTIDFAFAKTRTERYVPVAAKLEPYLAGKEFYETCCLCERSFHGDGRKDESPMQKKYNRAVKTIPGCERARCHSWRVYAQTMMIEAGVDDLIVKRIIGHKDAGNVHYGYTAARIEAMKKALYTIP